MVLQIHEIIPGEYPLRDPDSPIETHYGQSSVTFSGVCHQVSLPIVRQFVKSVEEKALGVKVLKGVRPDQQLVKVVNDQLVELMGGQQEDLNDPKDGPQVCPRTYALSPVIFQQDITAPIV